MGFTKNIPHTNAQQVELLAIFEGLRISVTNLVSPLEINSDSSTAIDIISPNYLGCCNIILECRCLMQALETPLLRHTCREQNRIADILARTGTGNTSFDQLQILTIPLICAVETLAADNRGNVFLRKIATDNVINLNYGTAQINERTSPGSQMISCNATL